LFQQNLLFLSAIFQSLLDLRVFLSVFSSKGTLIRLRLISGQPFLCSNKTYSSFLRFLSVCDWKELSTPPFFSMESLLIGSLIGYIRESHEW
jgi:hypothetical protein